MYFCYIYLDICTFVRYIAVVSQKILDGSVSLSASTPPAKNRGYPNDESALVFYILLPSFVFGGAIFFRMIASEC